MHVYISIIILVCAFINFLNSFTCVYSNLHHRNTQHDTAFMKFQRFALLCSGITLAAAFWSYRKNSVVE
jgi:hypothetical protein